MFKLFDDGALDAHIRKLQKLDPPKASTITKRKTKPAAKHTGVVDFYIVDHYGFLKNDAGGDDLFFHHSVVVDGADLRSADRVTFGIKQGRKGPEARAVRRVA
jgi:cold shock CspA family protein